MSDSSQLDGRAGRELIRRAKIVCTIGPASNSEELIRELMRAGMDVARLNFSHGTQGDHARSIQRLRRIAQKEGRTICILQDLQGPKIRTGRLKDGKRIELTKGSRLIITPQDVPGTPERISTTFTTLARDVAPGARILLSDGLIELRVTAVQGDEVECEVINGGQLGEHQGINIPGAALSIPSLTKKDRDDLDFGLKHGVDVIALSFVRTAEDVRAVKKIVAERRRDTPVIAKLEKPQAIDNLEAILEAADGVMVARGDLGVEMPPEEVPIIQKKIIARALEWRKPVITATQMLESMIENPRPTRAEASDVANAIFDGTDAVMLSGETARGKYPIEATQMMARIVREAEAHMSQHRPPVTRSGGERLSVGETICESVAHAADELDMRGIVIFTETGNTARLISKYRPRSIVYGFAESDAVCNRLNLFWGITPLRTPRMRSIDAMVRAAEKELLRRDVVSAGDVIGIATGTKHITGFTNLMWLHTVGSASRDRVVNEQRASKSARPSRSRSR